MYRLQWGPEDVSLFALLLTCVTRRIWVQTSEMSQFGGVKLEQLSHLLIGPEFTY